jgi:phosphoglycolate phosphatase
MRFQAVLFDLDGTLLNTLGDIADSANHVLKGLNFPPHDTDDYRHFIGNGIEMLMKRALPEGQRNMMTLLAGTRSFRHIYSQNWNVRSKPYDGVTAMLKELVRRHLKLAVLSNKPDDLTRKCVKTFFPNCPFDRVLGHHDAIAPKPDPTGANHIAQEICVPSKQILYVGDSAVDMETARAAGMYPGGALWGFRTLKELQDSGARTLLKHPLKVLSLVEE